MLAAITAGYPSAVVREQTAAFIETGASAMQHTASLFADKTALGNDGQPAAQWQEQASAAYSAVDDAWKPVSDALHADDHPGPKSAVNGPRPRRPRTSTERGKTGAEAVK